MTNRVRPEFRERAEVVRAVAAATNGKGVPKNGHPVLAQPQVVQANGDLIFTVADAVCACVLLGRDVALNAQTVAKVPHFGNLLAQMRAEWPEPTPVQAAKIALVEALATFQATVYALAPKVVEAQKAAAAAEPAYVPTVDAPMPEAPPEPAGLHALACPTCEADSGHLATCPDAPTG